MAIILKTPCAPHCYSLQHRNDASSVMDQASHDIWSGPQSIGAVFVPLPSMTASSLSSIVTQPCRFCEIAYLIGTFHSLHQISSLCTIQRRPGCPLAVVRSEEHTSEL